MLAKQATRRTNLGLALGAVVLAVTLASGSRAAAGHGTIVPASAVVTCGEATDVPQSGDASASTREQPGLPH